MIIINYGIVNFSNKSLFIRFIIGCVVLIIVGVFILVRMPKDLSNSESYDGTLYELDTVSYIIVLDLHKQIKLTYEFDKKDLPNIRAFLANNQIDSVNVRIWAKRSQARQIEMNGIMVKEYNWWKYAQPAFWLMILPGTIILLLLVLDRKRLLKEPEQTKNK